MARLGRPGLSDERKNELWERWHAGASISAISRAMGKPAGSVYTILRTRGGVYSPPRRRRASHLTLQEREEISRGLAQGESMRTIGRRLGRAPSTISREVARNKGCSTYRAIDAHDRAWYRAKRPKRCRLDENPVLADFVRDRLVEDWSPRQIAGFLAVMRPDTPEMRVSHETIYQSLFVQGRGELRRELARCLRSGRTCRKTRGTVDGRGRIPGMVNISERPAEAADRAVPGHWEGDLILGEGGRSAVGTLVERSTRLVLLLHLADGRSAVSVEASMRNAIASLPAELRRSITWDQGAEMSTHASFTTATGIPIYFCDPHAPWQRGSNENTNGLLRQYLPKGTDLSTHSDADLKRVQRSLNDRPRKTLGYLTPSEAYAQVVAATA